MAAADLAQILEASALAVLVNSSPLVLGSLSGAHLIGLTLVVGGALVWNLRRIGLLFTDRTSDEISGPAARAMTLGLVLSIVTGSLLFLPRASTAIRVVSGRARVAGVASLALWLAVALVWFDLGLLGVGFVRSRVSAVYRRLMPWASVGFLSMFVTGGMLFTGFVTRALTNAFFLTKMSALGLAAANAIVYHLVTERGIAAWDDQVRPPAPARLAGLVSIILWAVVILCGRLMSYTMF